MADTKAQGPTALATAAVVFPFAGNPIEKLIQDFIIEFGVLPTVESGEYFQLELNKLKASLGVKYINVYQWNCIYSQTLINQAIQKCLKFKVAQKEIEKQVMAQASMANKKFVNVFDELMKGLKVYESKVVTELGGDVRHPETKQCPDLECTQCGMRDCVFSEPLHFHHDDCPAKCWKALFPQPISLKL